MKNNKGTDVVLRPKRQVTLPREICERLGIKPGDVLVLTVEDSTLGAWVTSQNMKLKWGI